MQSAARLVGEQATVEAVYVVMIPTQLPIDAAMDREEARGVAVLESARIAGRRAGVQVRTSLIRTRNPGAALVDEARRRASDVIYLGTVHAPPSEAALGPTATYLLAKRPCRIVIETDTAARRARPAPAPQPREPVGAS